VALAPSSDGGTSALLRGPRDIIPAAFGPDSARAHRDLAVSAGVPFEELALPSLAIDIDEREDLEKFASSASAGRRTRALLVELLPGFAA
jgi:2-phospho-L-lactate guanylyltransferase (CobY/MobA/RfbA family)